MLDDWNWNEKTESSQFLASDKEETNIQNWFDKFILKLSPYGNLIVVASKRNIVICTGSLTNTDHMNFTVSSRIELTDKEKYRKYI